MTVMVINPKIHLNSAKLKETEANFQDLILSQLQQSLKQYYSLGSELTLNTNRMFFRATVGT